MHIASATPWTPLRGNNNTNMLLLCQYFEKNGCFFKENTGELISVSVFSLFFSKIFISTSINIYTIMFIITFLLSSTHKSVKRLS